MKAGQSLENEKDDISITCLARRADPGLNRAMQRLLCWASTIRLSGCSLPETVNWEGADATDRARAGGSTRS